MKRWIKPLATSALVAGLVAFVVGVVQHDTRTTAASYTGPSAKQGLTQPRAAAAVPDGVPTSEVGALELNLTGAQVLSDFARNDHTTNACYADPASIETSGSYSTSGTDAELTTNGTLDNCIQLISPRSYTYGTFEARVDLPAGPDGTIANWPAFWLVGQNWPADGEFDIMEGQGGYQAVDFTYGSGTDRQWWQRDIAPGWHTFDGVWGPRYISVYIDGTQIMSWPSRNVTSEPMEIIFDNTTGSYGYTTGQPSTLLVQYLRVWGYG